MMNHWTSRKILAAKLAQLPRKPGIARCSLGGVQAHPGCQYEPKDSQFTAQAFADTVPRQLPAELDDWANVFVERM
jgi:hypothetical protein